MDMATILQWCGGLVVIGGGAGVLIAGGRWMFGTLRKVNDFLEDWRGEEPRPGYPGRPGVLERLVKLEEHAATTSHEVQPNSGASLKDQMNRLDRAIPDVVARLDAIETQMSPRALVDGTQA
jgi:hypothetical protein